MMIITYRIPLAILYAGMQWVLMQFLEVRYEKKYPSWVYYVFIVLSATLQMVTACVDALIVFKSPAFLLGCLGMGSLFYSSGKKFQSVGFSFLFFMGIMLLELVTLLIFQTLRVTLQLPEAISTDIYGLWAARRIGICAMIDIFLIVAIYRPVKRMLAKGKVETGAEIHQTIFLIIMALIQIIPLTWLMTSTIVKPWLFIIILAACMAFDLYLLYIFALLNKRYALERDVAIQKQQNVMQQRYLDQMERQDRITRKFIHDTKNHLQTLEGLYHAGDTQAADAYFSRTIAEMDRLGMKRFCADPTLNIILSDKAAYCEELGIRLKLDLQDDRLDFMEPFDITTIFGNLLDNAVEAAEGQRAEDYEIRLSMRAQGEMLAIAVENPKPAGDERVPVKSKKGHQGIGLGNVSAAVARYGGTMDIREDDGWFKVQIFLGSRS
jgi:two-component system sensor histidine kinase AgrC